MLVHAKFGCELSAAYLEREGDTVVGVERRVTRAELDAVPLDDPITGVIPDIPPNACSTRSRMVH